MNKTPIQNLAKISLKTVPAVKKEKKSTRAERGCIFDPLGLAAIDQFVAIHNGSVRKAAEAMGVSENQFSAWKHGKAIRKCYAELARLAVAEHKRKTAPKVVLKPKQHTAVITLSNEHQEDFKAAVESVGGVYTILDYPPQRQQLPNDSILTITGGKHG